MNFLAPLIMGVAAIASLQEQPDPGLDSDVIAHPQWAVRPTLRFPMAASEQDVQTGEVVLRCEIGLGGHPVHCEVVSETPPGMGFGSAAVEGIQGGVLAPEWVKGWPADRPFFVPVRFFLAG